MDLKIVNDVQDVKGLPLCMCCKTTGSYVGVCPWCKSQGIRDRNKTVYPTAVTFLPKVANSQYGDRGVKVLVCYYVLHFFSYLLPYNLTFVKYYVLPFISYVLPNILTFEQSLFRSVRCANRRSPVLLKANEIMDHWIQMSQMKKKHQSTTYRH